MINYQNKVIALIRREVVPALGCTEPIAVALAVAKAREILGKKPENVEVLVSPNLYKNGMGVGIPGTGMVGLPIAAALGAITGKSSDSLEVLKGVTPELVGEAETLIKENRIHIKVAETDEKLYVEAICKHGEDCAVAIIQQAHNQIVKVVLNDVILEENLKKSDGSEADDMADFDIDMSEIYHFAKTIPLEKIEFMLDDANYNAVLANYGLQHKSGLGIGANLLKSIEKGYLDHSFMNIAMAETAAASDARMSGAMLPAMSNSGSGNQGITAMMPVISVAKFLNSSREDLIRALTISNLTVIHIKKKFGRLSAACGCVVASTGAACGVTYLLKGTENQMNYAIKNMFGNLTGMVCDGAKLGCAFKVATGTNAAIQAALLALDDVCISSNDGIIEDSVEKCIHNIAVIAAEAMNETDAMVLRIMTNKE